MPRLVARNGAFIRGLEIEARYFVGFFGLAFNNKRAPSGPTAFDQSLFLVDAAFQANQDVGKLSVSCSPCINQFVGGGFTQHFLDGGKKVLTNNAVLLGTDTDRAVLGGDVLDGIDKHRRVVDVFGVSQNGACQRLLLMAACLVRVVENVLQLGIACEHALVKVRDQCNAVFAQNGDGGFDKFDLTGGQHKFLPV